MAGPIDAQCPHVGFHRKAEGFADSSLTRGREEVVERLVPMLAQVVADPQGENAGASIAGKLSVKGFTTMAAGDLIIDGFVDSDGQDALGFGVA